MRATRFTSAVRSTALCCAASLLLACEQDPDVVISSTAPLDAGQQQQQQEDSPATNNDEDCDDLEADSLVLSRVLASTNVDWTMFQVEEAQCVWRASDANILRVLNERIFNMPAAEVSFEDTPPSPLCNFLDRFFDGGTSGPTQAPFFSYPSLEYFRLCPGYCESLKLWLKEHDEMLVRCLADGA